MSLQPGSLAPNFTTTVIGGDYASATPLQLSDLLGGKLPVVLYFYPKDNTPGCTTQACALRDSWSEVRARAQIFGVSTDSVASHMKFLQKQNLPFPLIADEDKSIVQAYGVWGEKSLYGVKYLGTERSTFIINPDGTIRAILAKVRAAQHLEKLLAHL
jgi:thioredoxin-dependent peroxiredoxin